MYISIYVYTIGSVPDEYGEGNSQHHGHVYVEQQVGGPVTIPCPFRSYQIWSINGVIYGPSNLPPGYSRHYVGLEIFPVNSSHDGMEFFCFTGNNTSHSLKVIKGPHVVLNIKTGMLHYCYSNNSFL